MGLGGSSRVGVGSGSGPGLLRVAGGDRRPGHSLPIQGSGTRTLHAPLAFRFYYWLINWSPFTGPFHLFSLAWWVWVGVWLPACLVCVPDSDSEPARATGSYCPTRDPQTTIINKQYCLGLDPTRTNNQASYHITCLLLRAGAGVRPRSVPCSGSVSSIRVSRYLHNRNHDGDGDDER